MSLLSLCAFITMYSLLRSRDWTQGFMNDRQELYQLSWHPALSILFKYLQIKELGFFFVSLLRLNLILSSKPLEPQFMHSSTTRLWLRGRCYLSPHFMWGKPSTNWARIHTLKTIFYDSNLYNTGSRTAILRNNVINSLCKLLWSPKPTVWLFDQPKVTSFHLDWYIGNWRCCCLLSICWTVKKTKT